MLTEMLQMKNVNIKYQNKTKEYIYGIQYTQYLALKGLINLILIQSPAHTGTGNTMTDKNTHRHIFLNCVLINLTYWHISTSFLCVFNRSGDRFIEEKTLLLAVRSYVFFSQLSAWLSASHGIVPRNILYRSDIALTQDTGGLTSFLFRLLVQIIEAAGNLT